MCCDVRFVGSGDTVYLGATKYISVRRGTLERYVKDTSPSPEELVHVHLGRRTVPPSEIENKLLEYYIIMDQTFYGLKRYDIKRMAFQLAIRII